ncbi:MAG: hypothetical protein KKF44_02565 [Nanoarchaeota archaeon]|nr:hypothetical protein [Nanoarchaeota archaeon]
MSKNKNVLILKKVEQLNDIYDTYLYANSLIEQNQSPDVLFTTQETIDAIRKIEEFSAAYISDIEVQDTGYTEFKGLVELIDGELRKTDAIGNHESIASQWIHDEILTSVPEQNKTYFKKELEIPDGLERTVKNVIEKIYDLQPKENFLMMMPLLNRERLDSKKPEDHYHQQVEFIKRIAEQSISLGANPIIQMIVPQKATDQGSVLTQILYSIHGLEFSKEIDTSIFQAYKKFSEAINIPENIPMPQAHMELRGDGKEGMNFFGTHVGYQIGPGTGKDIPLWDDPLSMILQPPYIGTSVIDKREPALRKCLFQTLPLELSTQTMDIDWNKMWEDNTRIKEIGDRVDRIEVKGNLVDVGDEQFKSYFAVELVKPDGEHRIFTKSDSNCRTIIDEEKTIARGSPIGTFANGPGGEAYVNPERVVGPREHSPADTAYLEHINEQYGGGAFGKIVGTYVGDVVMAMDKNYALKDQDASVTNKAIVIGFNENGHWKLLYAPKEITDKIEELSNEFKNLIKNMNEHKKMSDNDYMFNLGLMKQIGEFAINTNEKAPPDELYLIAAEKAAGCIHLAVMSGYDADRAGTVRQIPHWDIVGDAKRQKLDIVGYDSMGGQHYLMNQGNLIANTTQAHGLDGITGEGPVDIK